MLLAPGRHVETVEFEQLGVTLHQIDRRFLGGLGDLPGDRLRFDAAFIGDPVAELREGPADLLEIRSSSSSGLRSTR